MIDPTRDHLAWSETGTDPGSTRGMARALDRRVTEIMSWALLTAPLSMTCKQARAQAAARAVHHIPVLDGGLLVGMICTCDLKGARDDEPLGRRMRTPVVTVHANCASKDAMATMRGQDVDALPVLYHGFLIGIVTTGDLVRAHVWAEGERLTCTQCSAHHHVRRREPEGIYLCLACRERRTP